MAANLGFVANEPHPSGTIALSAEGLHGIRGLLHSPLADAQVTDRAARETLSVITASYEHHGGFRLRTLA